MSDTDNRNKMNGKIATNGISPFRNQLRKFNESEMTKEDYKKMDSKLLQASNSGTNGLLRLKPDGEEDEMTTIQKDDRNESDSSDDMASVTSESGSDSDGSDSDGISSDEPVIEHTFPGHKDNKQDNVEQNGDVSFSRVKEEPLSTTISGTSGGIGTNGFVNSQTDTTMSTTNDSLSKELVVSDGSDDQDDPSTSGSSDVVLGTVSKKGDQKDLHSTVEIIPLAKREMDNSGMISDASDMKDQTEMLAQLQKIVQEDEHFQQSGIDNTGETKSADFHSQSSLNTSADKKSDLHGLGSSQNDSEVSGNSDNFSNSVSVELNGNNMSNLGVIDSNSAAGSHGNKLIDSHDGNTQGIDKVCTNNASGEFGIDHTHGNIGHDGQGNSDHGNDNISSVSKQTAELDKPRNESSEITSFSNLENEASVSDETPRFRHNGLSYSPPNPESTVADGPLKNVEKKLLELEKSNTEQTAEVERLKSENDFLKTKFHKLEESSEHYRDIESRMLKRNEELERHLLGILKSQEIIYDLKEKLNATTDDNKKLSKDYQEALKALEAVDNMFGQKDALVKKWKEATEESRRLVELLKKHNAEITDLEQVDQLKEEIAGFQMKLSKAEQVNEESNKKNDELQDQSKVWKKKFEYENEQGIKLNYDLQEVKKAFKNNEKLTAKRGRKNQMLHLQLTELKDTLKLAKEKMIENDMRLKEVERKSTSTQEMYTGIIHEKEKQHSVLIKNSQTYQNDLVANIQIAEGLRREMDSLKETMSALESEKIATEEKLRESGKGLDETVAKQEEMRKDLETLQPELEKSKIAAVDSELYIEEQTVRMQELEEQCRELQGALQQFIYRGTKRHDRQSRHGRNLRTSHTFPTHPNLDMYKNLLAPPKTMQRRRTNPAPREAWVQSGQSDEDKTEVDIDKVAERFISSTVHPVTSQQTRPRSTYGDRSLSATNNPSPDQTKHNRDWVPKIVLVDSQKLEAGSENDSGSISADQYAMEYVKMGDKVLIEMPVEGRKQNLPGVVKYVGPVYHENFKKGIYAGLKLDIPVGDTNGNIGGRFYFHCLKKHGKFIKLSHILAVQNSRTQQFTRILPLGYK